MNKKILFLAIITPLLFLWVNNSCNTEVQENKVDTVVIVIHDTVEILQKFDDEWYKKNSDFCRRVYEDFYNLIKKSRIDDDLLKEFSNEVMPVFIVAGILFKDKIVLDASVLYYLKLYEQNIQGDMQGFNTTCNNNGNKYTMLIYEAYCIVSGSDPLAEPFTEDIYEWVKNSKYYLGNEDLIEEMERIDSLKKAGYHIPRGEFVKIENEDGTTTIKMLYD